MASILPDYEYDIFISYRHKDNRSDWVTKFVTDLQEEIGSTFKENISIYVDENQNDGLLETHDVNKSLEGKLKSVVFIPILSQTYCDPESFAWQYEFCAFNALASTDKIGRDIKLKSGNVASRILSININDLDTEDLQRIEKELKTKYRGIEFIFRSPGVNRPLRPDDKREENLNRLLYRDQINKVANALKEILYSIRYPEKNIYSGVLAEEGNRIHNETTETKGKPAPDKRMVNDKSIAVLPFVSLAQDTSQEYFADGMTENILIQLASIQQLRVISRTSVMQYKKTTKTAPEIALELGVKYILEGSAQAHANKVRINVQLIDAEKDDRIWSKSFVESMDDIFTVQDKVAEVVASQLQSSISSSKTITAKAVPTKNLEAYDLFLKGRHAFNQWNVEGYQIATDYLTKALDKDPEFKQAYSYLASCYSARMSWNGDLSPAEALPAINQYLDEAWKRGATDNDYLTKAFVELLINKDFAASEQLLIKANQLSPNNATTLYTYSYLLLMAGRWDEAQAMINQAKHIEPHSVAYFNYQGIYLYLIKNYEESVQLFKEGMKLFPRVVRFSDHLGRIYLTMGHYQEAKEALLSGLNDSNIRPPSMVAYLAIAYWYLDEKDKFEKLLDELLLRSEQNEKGVNFCLTHVYGAIKNYLLALSSLKKAQDSNDIDLIWLTVDPLLNEVRERLGASPDEKIAEVDFLGAEKFIIDKLQAELPSNLAYHNLDHIYDVVEASVKIAESENIDAEEIGLLRIAALYHDAGFITTYKNHEEIGCSMARQTLPPFGFSAAHLDAICSMIMATKIPQAPQNMLDKILCDADLDYLGRADFYEIGSCLFIEMKEHGYIETEREWNLTQKVFLENHRYHTGFGKSNREKKKQQHLSEVLSKLKR